MLEILGHTDPRTIHDNTRIQIFCVHHLEQGHAQFVLEQTKDSGRYLVYHTKYNTKRQTKKNTIQDLEYIVLLIDPTPYALTGNFQKYSKPMDFIIGQEKSNKEDAKGDGEPASDS